MLSSPDSFCNKTVGLPESEIAIGAGHAHDLPARTVTGATVARARGKSGLLVAVEHAIEIAIQGQPVTVPLGDTGIGHGTLKIGLGAELRLGEGRFVCVFRSKVGSWPIYVNAEEVSQFEWRSEPTLTR